MQWLFFPYIFRSWWTLKLGTSCWRMSVQLDVRHFGFYKLVLQCSNMLTHTTLSNWVRVISCSQNLPDCLSNKIKYWWRSHARRCLIALPLHHRVLLVLLWRNTEEARPVSYIIKITTKINKLKHLMRERLLLFFIMVVLRLSAESKSSWHYFAIINFS